MRRGYVLAEALIALIILGHCTLLISQMKSSKDTNLTSLSSTRELYSVMQADIERYQNDINKGHILGSGTDTLYTVYEDIDVDGNPLADSGRVVVSDVEIDAGTVANGRKIYVLSITTYYRDSPKNFIVDKVILSKGVGVSVG